MIAEIMRPPKSPSWEYRYPPAPEAIVAIVETVADQLRKKRKAA
jgi:hypothetical protein